MPESQPRPSAVRRRHRDGRRDDGAGPAGTPPPRPPPAGQPGLVSEALIRETVQRGHRWLRFPAPLEARFEADQSESRRIRLIISGLFATLMYGSFAITDPQVMPDIGPLSWRLHLVLTPLILFGTAIIALPIRPWMREASFALVALMLSVSIVFTLQSSNAATAVSHATTLFLVPMFAGIVARMRFRYTLLVTLGTLEALAFVDAATPLQALFLRDTLMIDFAAISITVLASYMLEYQERTTYLHRLIDAMQHEALADANERLQRLAMFDSLTGIHNRRQFELDLDASWSSAVRSGRPLSVLIADVDFFKRYNDGYGHPAGDDCLRRVAQALNEVAETHGGSAARLGGEEFVITLPGSDAARALEAGQAMVAAVRELEVPHRLSLVAPIVTVSVGVATAQAQRGVPSISLVEAADHALYQAKTAGRDRVAIDGEHPS